MEKQILSSLYSSCSCLTRTVVGEATSEVGQEHVYGTKQQPMTKPAPASSCASVLLPTKSTLVELLMHSSFQETGGTDIGQRETKRHVIKVILLNIDRNQ